MRPPWSSHRTGLPGDFGAPRMCVGGGWRTNRKQRTMGELSDETDYFRSMTPGSDGAPEVGRSARRLGVRVPQDVQQDAAGLVQPRTGGLSVSPDSLWNLPNHRRPRPLGRGSTGPAADTVYAIAEPLLEMRALVVRRDPGRPDKHAFEEPSAPTPLSAYESALESTCSAWRRVWP